MLTGLEGPVLLGIDAAIGVPRHVGERFQKSEFKSGAGFLDWARWLFSYGSPDVPCKNPRCLELQQTIYPHSER